MGVLRKVEGQHERLAPGILNFNTTTVQCCLSNETDFRIELTKLHVLMVVHRQLADTATATVSVEKRGTLRTEPSLGPGLEDQSEDGGLLITQEIAIDDPLGVHALAGELLRQPR